MFNIRKKLADKAAAKDKAAKQALEAQAQTMQQKLDACLQKPDVAARYLALLEFKNDLKYREEDLRTTAEKKRQDKCLKSAFLYTTPVAIGLVCLEPVSWGLTLAAAGKVAYSALLGYVPAPMMNNMLKDSGFGRKKVGQEMAADFDLVRNAVATVDRALVAIESNPEDVMALAKSGKTDEMTRYRPALNTVLAAAFRDVALRAQTPPPSSTPPANDVKPPKEDGFRL